MSNFVTVGDAMQRLAYSINQEMLSVLQLLHNQDPELRTIECLNFLSRSRKRLLQLYALLQWLQRDRNQQCLDDVAATNGQLIEKGNSVCQSLDELFFAHAGMYAQRSRRREVAAASDILCRQNYSTLPSSIFSCGRPIFPSFHEELSDEQLKKDVEVFIRGKIGLCGGVKQMLQLFHGGADRSMEKLISTARTQLRSGVLHLVLPTYFRITMTLQHLRLDSPWTVLSCRLLVGLDHRGQPTTPFDLADLPQTEAYLLSALHSATKRASNGEIKANTTAAETDANADANMETDTAAAAATAIDGNTVCGGGGGDDDTSLDLRDVQRCYGLCRFAAVGLGLRLWYLQCQGKVDAFASFAHDYPSTLTANEPVAGLDSSACLSVAIWPRTADR